MKKEVSIYLDLFRFLAALVVFLSHVASQEITGGFLWQTKPYAQTAVMAFFVLSGFVIAYVVDVKEKDARSYTIARVSRIYSVVIPALLITIICDYIGIQINADFYYERAWDYPEGSQVVNYLLSTFLLQNIWELNLNPGINGPFWSLTYEIFYYLIFATLIFPKTKLKWLAALLLGLMAGPTIIALFPLWLSGYVAYCLVSKGKADNINQSAAAIISVLALGLVIFIGPEVRAIKFSLPYIERVSILGDYFDGLLIALHLIYVRQLVSYFSKPLGVLEKLALWLGSLTFSLYLFHRPIIQLVGALHDGPVDNTLYRLVVIVVPLFIVMTVGRWFEVKKRWLKAQLGKLYPKTNKLLPA